MPISGLVPLQVSFTSTSSPDVTEWHWYFGDGDESTSSVSGTATHIYTMAGTYTVTLEVTTPNGTATITDIVTVGAAATAYSAPSPAYGSTVGTEPLVMLRLSNDGGKTWICELQREAGKMGEYWRRVRWNRLGMARRRVFEVSVTDPIPWRITGAFVQMTPAKDPRAAA